MSEEKRKLITESCPKLYRKMKFLGCDDGWLDLIFELSKKLETEIEKLSTEDQEKFYVVQIKEKFGSLRFYMSYENDAMGKHIRIAEEKSCETCEGCGSENSNIVGRNWLVNLCEDCYIVYHMKKYNNDENAARIAYNEFLIEVKKFDES